MTKNDAILVLIEKWYNGITCRKSGEEFDDLTNVAQIIVTSILIIWC